MPISKEKNKDIEHYGDEDINVLKIVDAIRQSPGMYIGSSDKQGFHHLINEVLENSADEALIKNEETLVKVIISKDKRSIVVEDNGRGIPTGKNPITGVSSLQTVFTFAHSGAKFRNKEDSGVYKTAGGMHGIGLTAVNALSEHLEVWSKYKDTLGHIIFKRGEVVFSEIKENETNETGVKVSFIPDSKIFKDQFDNIIYFDSELVEKRMEELSRLNKNLIFAFKDSPEKEDKIFHFTDGLPGWVRDINSNDESLENSKICYGNWSDSNEKHDYFTFDFAFQYTKSRKYRIKSFCNSIATSSGGTHQDGFEGGLVKACQTWVKEKYPNWPNLIKEDIIGGLTAIISVNMKGQVFSGQTKEKLTNPKIRELVRSATSNIVLNFFQDNNSTAESICRKIFLHAQNRIKSEQQQNLLKSVKQSTVLPEKLADCISKIPEEKSIFLVEGDSAAGSAKLARNANTQAVISIKGKMINVEKKSIEIFKNKEINSLTNALGFRPDEIIDNYYNKYRSILSDENKQNFFKETVIIKSDFFYKDKLGLEKSIPAGKKLSFEEVTILVEETKKKLISKLRYWKIIIMADADIDGKHIECLVVTFFAKYFFFLIEEHHLYLAVCPLYEVKKSKGYDYLYSDSDLENYNNVNKNKNFFVHRIKGLGEMDPDKLRDTTMRESNINCLHGITYADYDHVYNVIDQLMGIKSDYRKKLLEKGAYKNSVLKVENNRVEITHALFLKFLAYAYEVVEMRAIPQSQDGFKIVQRRIIYTLHELKVYSDKQHVKSSKAIGEVMGKYHPHGDQAIYQAMIKMAQGFNYRYPLIDGKGNWGSLDGDAAAASRYTEVRLTPIVSQYLKYLPYNTVKMIDNYDGREKEPLLLPANLNLLLNGSSGIAVGMNTNIPPHYLPELVDATISLINNPNLTVENLFSIFKGPDFPTGGLILEKDKLISFYEKGEGTFYVRAKTEILSAKLNGKKEKIIVITNIPFKTNKSEIVKQIRDREIKGIRNVFDFSNLENPVDIRCVIDPNYDGSVILNELFRTTDLQVSFSMRLRTLVEGKPKVVSLKEILINYIIVSLEHIEQKARFIRDKNKRELLNLQIKNLAIKEHEKIANIVKDNTSQEEKNIVIKKLFFDKIKETEISEEDFVEYILDTPINFRQFLPEKHKELEQKIVNIKEENKKLSFLITDPTEKKKILINDLKELKKKYSFDARRTEFSEEVHFIDDRKLTPPENRLVVFSIFHNAEEKKINTYLSVFLDNLEINNVTSQGKILKSRGNNNSVFKIKRTDDCLLFTNYGKVYCLNFYKFNSVNKSTNLREEYGLNLRPDEYPTCFLITSLNDFDFAQNKKIVLITDSGHIIKKISLSKLVKLNKNSGKRVLNLFNREINYCVLHKEELENHKNDNCCDVLKEYAICEVYKKIKEEIKTCSNCKLIIYRKKDNDFISKCVLIDENVHDAEIVFEKKYSDNTIKNFRISLYPESRKVDEQGKKIYCSLHSSKVEEHRRSHDCKYLLCEDIKNILRSVKKCNNCQNSNFFVRKMRKTMPNNCNRVIDLLLIKKQDFIDKENLRLLLVRKDNSCLRKVWNEKKHNLGKNHTTKRLKYCKDHWEKSIYNKDKKKDLLNITKEEVKKTKSYINFSKLEEKEKNELLSKFRYASDFFKDDFVLNIDPDIIDITSLEKELGQKEDPLLSNFITNLKERVLAMQKFIENLKDNKLQYEELKLEINNCRICIGKCKRHQFMLENHKKEDCCNKDINELSLISFKCEKFKEIVKSITNCKLCNALLAKKHVVKYENPLIRVFLFNKKSKYLVYVLSENYFSSYGKEDLLDFIAQDKRKSIQIYKSSKRLVDVKLENVDF